MSEVIYLKLWNSGSGGWISSTKHFLPETSVVHGLPREFCFRLKINPKSNIPFWSEHDDEGLCDDDARTIFIFIYLVVNCPEDGQNQLLH